MQRICDFHLKSDENHAGSDMTSSAEHIVKNCCERRHEHELLLSESELELPCNASSASWIRHTGDDMPSDATQRAVETSLLSALVHDEVVGRGWMEEVDGLVTTITRLRRVENLKC